MTYVLHHAPYNALPVIGLTPEYRVFGPAGLQKTKGPGHTPFVNPRYPPPPEGSAN